MDSASGGEEGSLNRRGRARRQARKENSFLFGLWREKSPRWCHKQLYHHYYSLFVFVRIASVRPVCAV